MKLLSVILYNLYRKFLSFAPLDSFLYVIGIVRFRAVAAQGTSVLAQELLAEIPTQIINFLEGKKIIPKNVSTSK